MLTEDITMKTRLARLAAIIDHALEDLCDWKPPTPLEGVGPKFPHVYETFAEALSQLRRDLTAALEICSDEELERDFLRSTSPRLNALFDREGRFARMARRLAQLKKTAPANYVGGWAIAERQIDRGYWRAHALIGLTEAALLSVGREPRKTNYDALFKGYGRCKEGDEVLYFLEDQYEAIARGLRLDPEDENAQVDVDVFYQWVRAHGFRIDPRFRRVLKERADRQPRAAEPSVVAKEPTAKKLHGSSRKVHSRILLAIAKSRYGLVDQSNVGKVANAIVHDGDLQGISFDGKVVRDLLRQGLRDLNTPD